jgi:hypothetical protein
MPDLLILDLSLAAADLAELTDGFAFLRLLRRNHPEADPAVIFYSVNHSPEVEARPIAGRRGHNGQKGRRSPAFEHCSYDS